jgi:hypothetical protein
MIIPLFFVCIVALGFMFSSPNLASHRVVLSNNKFFIPNNNMDLLKLPKQPYSYKEIENSSPFGCNSIKVSGSIVNQLDLECKEDCDDRVF